MQYNMYKDTNKPSAKANLFAFCRGEVSKTKSKITIKPSVKANFICILPKRDGVKDTESREKTGICSQFSGAHPIFYKDRCGIARKDFRAKILSVALKI